MWQVPDLDGLYQESYVGCRNKTVSLKTERGFRHRKLEYRANLNEESNGQAIDKEPDILHPYRARTWFFFYHTHIYIYIYKLIEVIIVISMWNYFFS